MSVMVGIPSVVYLSSNHAVYLYWRLSACGHIDVPQSCLPVSSVIVIRNVVRDWWR